MFVRRSCALVAAVVLLAVWAPGAAVADAVFLGSSPAGQSTVGGVVNRLEIVFNERVTGARVTVEGPDGLQPLTSETDSGRVLLVEFDSLVTEGRYIVRYEVISQDLDPVKGGFAFAYQADAPEPLPVTAPLSSDSDSSTARTVLVGASIGAVAFLGLQTAIRTRRLRQLRDG